jgi:hypothetical protein
LALELLRNSFIALKKRRKQPERYVQYAPNFFDNLKKELDKDEQVIV